MKSIPKRLAALALAVCLSLGLAPATLAVDNFTDVPADHWAYADIMACAEAGTVTGFADGSFHPNDEVTGTQFIVMLTRTFYNDLVEAAKATETSSWYAPYVAAAENADIVNTIKVKVEDKAMNRYGMASVLHSIIAIEGIGSTVPSAKLQEAKTALKDYDNLQLNGFKYMSEVKYCYALGVIQGLSDGYFHGEQTMTRAQACTVVMRMVRLMNGETLPTQTPQPQQPEAPVQTGTGKLANGKDATVENVLEMLEQLKVQYPEGTTWDHYTRYENASTEVGASFSIIAKDSRSMASAVGGCGGYAAMISDTIFGHNTGREVTDISKVRPGDILFIMNKDTSSRHIALVIETVAPGAPGNPNTEGWFVYTTDGGGSGGIIWDTLYSVRGCGKENANPLNGEYHRFVTRYPD